MTKTLYIIGAGGHGKVILDCALSMNKWSQIYFIDDRKKNINGFDVIGKIEEVKGFINEDSEFIVAIGDNLTRMRITRKLEKINAKLALIIHKNATISNFSKICKGSVVMAGAVINSSSKIGQGSIINTNSVIEHDVFIDEFVHVSPGVIIAGNTTIGKRSWIGSGATIINSIDISNNTIIGAGAVVISNIGTPGVYVGVPASPI